MLKHRSLLKKVQMRGGAARRPRAAYVLALSAAEGANNIWALFSSLLARTIHERDPGVAGGTCLGYAGRPVAREAFMNE
jgi:hypothetical protein